MDKQLHTIAIFTQENVFKCRLQKGTYFVSTSAYKKYLTNRIVGK